MNIDIYVASKHGNRSAATFEYRISGHRMNHAIGQRNLVADELKKCAALTPADMDDQDAQRIAKKISETRKWPEDF